MDHVSIPPADYPRFISSALTPSLTLKTQEQIVQAADPSTSSVTAADGGGGGGGANAGPNSDIGRSLGV